METKSGTNGNRIEALKKRESEIHKQILALNENKRRREARLAAREFSAVGEALCKYAAQSPEFHKTLKAMLGAAVATIDESTKTFLARQGWGL
jgi:hypothetical protein